MMKKLSLRFTALTFAVLLLFASVMMASAATGTLDDGAQLFTAAQQSDLQQRLNAASEKTGWQFIIHTANDGVSSGSMESHYDSYYASHSYSADAIMLVIDKASDNRIILSYGDVKSYFKGDTGRYDTIKSAMKPYLSSGDYYTAAQVFIEKASGVSSMGKPNMFVQSLKKVGPFAGIAGVIAAVAFFFVNRSRYKNMGKSGTYDLASNSRVDLNEVEDTFVTQHTTVRTIQRDNDHDSSSPSSDGHSSGTF